MRASAGRTTARRVSERCPHIARGVPPLRSPMWLAVWLVVVALAAVFDAPPECYVALGILGPDTSFRSGSVDA